MSSEIRLALPKGRISEEVVRLLGSTGIAVRSNGRSYRPQVSEPEIEAKYLKPQNIPRLLEIGAHDCGFTGHDWVVESGADVVEVLDTTLDPVTLVAAAPEGTTAHLAALDRPYIVASRAALADPARAGRIETLATLLRSVLEARRRVLLEMNVAAERLAAVVAVLPAMKSPTIQELYGGKGYAVKAAVPREGLAGVILRLRQAGATDLIAYTLEKVIP